MMPERKRVPTNGDRIAAFAHEYRGMQNIISRLSNDPLPPCYYCNAEQIWSCSQSNRECRRFRDYCGQKESMN